MGLACVLCARFFFFFFSCVAVKPQTSFTQLIDILNIVSKGAIVLVITLVFTFESSFSVG